MENATSPFHAEPKQSFPTWVGKPATCFDGILSEMRLYRASEATTFVNTCRLLRTNPISVSALATVHSENWGHFFPYAARNTRTPSAACRRSAVGFGIASSPNSMALFNGSDITSQLK